MLHCNSDQSNFGIDWLDSLNLANTSPQVTEQTNINQRICYLCGNSVSHIPLEALRLTNYACELCSRLEISQGTTISLPKELQLSQCPTCKRYQRPPFVHVEWESHEMKILLLQRLKPFVGKHTIENAEFIYSEEHSKRLLIRVRIKDRNTDIISMHLITFKVTSCQCTSCQRAYTPHQYQAVVQVRLKTKEKSAISAVFDNLMKKKTIEKAIGALEQTYGFDFYFNSRSDAQSVVHTLEANYVVRTAPSKTLKGHNQQCNTYDYVFTFVCDILNVKKHDVTLFYENTKLIGLGLVERIGINIQLLTVPRFEYLKLSGYNVANYGVLEICNKMNAVKFMVVDIEEDGHLKLMKVRFSDETNEYEGYSDDLLCARSPLCEHLVAGDIVAGYLMLQDNNSNLINEALESIGMKQLQGLPDVIIFKVIKDVNFIERERLGDKVEWFNSKESSPIKMQEVRETSVGEDSSSDANNRIDYRPTKDMKASISSGEAFRNILVSEDRAQTNLINQSLSEIRTLRVRDPEEDTSLDDVTKSLRNL